MHPDKGPFSRSGLPEEDERNILKTYESYSQGFRYASGVEYLLAQLERFPANALILDLLSLLLYQGMGRSKAKKAAALDQHLTDAMLADTRLDPVFNQCTRCGNSWVGVHHILPYEALEGMNMMGYQCGTCEKLYCRNCAEGIRTGANTDLMQCPDVNCGGRLQVYRGRPTGRKATQARRIDLPLVFVLFLREGPINPDEEYVIQTIKRLCPDVLEGQPPAQIRAVGVESSQWPDIEHLAGAILNRVKNREYTAPEFMWDRLEADYQGDRLYLIRVYRKPADRKEKSNAFEEMLADMEQLLQRGESARDIHEMRQIANQLLLAGNFTAGIGLMQQAIQRYPQAMHQAEVPAPVRRSLAKYDAVLEGIERSKWLKQQGRQTQARENLEEALQEAPCCALLYSSLGYLYLLEKKFETAEQYIQTALRLDPRLAEAYNNLGLLYFFAGRPALARAAFEKTLQIDPGNTDAKTNLANLERQTPQETGAPKRTGAIFWFDSAEISETVSNLYGKYIFRQILPLLTGHRQPIWVFDGDCVPQEQVSLPTVGPEERERLQSFISTGVDRYYLIAVFGGRAFESIDASLKNNQVTGYSGYTSYTSDLNSFEKLTGQLSLVPSLQVLGDGMKILDFSFLSEEELGEMGFELID